MKSHLIVALALSALFTLPVDARSPPAGSNAAAARAVLEEVFGKGRIAENEHLYSPDFVVHGHSRDAGRAEDRAATEGWRKAFPDLQVEVLHLVSQGDLVSVHWRATGTNTGEGNGLPATGKHGSITAMTLFSFKNGLIAEEWTEMDPARLMAELGLGQAAGAPPTAKK